jgi:hypothetical protein
MFAWGVVVFETTIAPPPPPSLELVLETAHRFTADAPTLQTAKPAGYAQLTMLESAAQTPVFDRARPTVFESAAAHCTNFFSKVLSSPGSHNHDKPDSVQQ